MTADLHLTWFGDRQLFMVASARHAVDAGFFAMHAYSRIAKLLVHHHLSIVHERIFGSCDVAQRVMKARSDALMENGISDESPYTYIQGHPPWGTGLAGLIIQAVQGNAVFTIEDQGRPCGQGWQAEDKTYLILQNIQARHRGIETPGPDQTSEVITRARRILENNHAQYSDTVRTWFYIKDILSWYAHFNQTRTVAYRELGIIGGSPNEPHLLPASTGIEGITPQASAVSMDLLAIIGQEGSSNPTVKRLKNRAQMEAYQYGSSFSRAALIQDREAHLLELSGTAAIDENGKTISPKSISAQVTATFDNIEALLQAQGSDLEHMAAATVFIKPGADADVFWSEVERRGLKTTQWVCVTADICRSSLLFEIDGEVIW